MWCDRSSKLQAIVRSNVDWLGSIFDAQFRRLFDQRTPHVLSTIWSLLFVLLSCPLCDTNKKKTPAIMPFDRFLSAITRLRKNLNDHPISHKNKNLIVINQYKDPDAILSWVCFLFLALFRLFSQVDWFFFFNVDFLSILLFGQFCIVLHKIWLD